FYFNPLSEKYYFIIMNHDRMSEILLEKHSIPESDYLNALKILNNDTSTMLQLISSGYRSKIFGTVGEHLVILRNRSKLLEISEILNVPNEETQMIDTTYSYKLDMDDTEFFRSKTSESTAFIDSFLPLAKRLNYQDITFLFDPSSTRSPILQGILKKYTNIIKQYKNRYVILFFDRLNYYKIKDGRRILRRSVNLGDIAEIRRVKYKKKNKNDIIYEKLIINLKNKKEKRLIFKSDHKYIQEWYDLINKNMTELNVDLIGHYINTLLFYKLDSHSRIEFVTRFKDFRPILIYDQTHEEKKDVFYDLPEDVNYETECKNVKCKNDGLTGYFKCLLNLDCDEHHQTDQIKFRHEKILTENVFDLSEMKSGMKISAKDQNISK
ncbi:putative Pleckstrin like-type, Oxysterol-binding protein, Pleckstrin like domain protein, partial [Pseudoloma neurophilia]